MPGIYWESMNRKDFMATVAHGFGVMAFAAVAGSGDAIADEHGESQDVHLALLADTHIPENSSDGHRGFRPVDNLKQVVAQVLTNTPEATIICGDAARLSGRKEDYESLKQILAPLAEKTPVVIGLGNHDDRRNFFQVFNAEEKGKSPVGGKHVAVMERGGLRFIVLDSLLYVNKVAGLLGNGQRSWLAEFLAKADKRPTVLFVHHTLGDGDGDLLDADRLFGILEPHRQVKAIFYGHSHRYAIEQRGDLHLINLPAVGYNFSNNQPVGWVDARFSPGGVELTLHAIGGNRDDHGKKKFVEWKV
jgi:Icc protein